MSDERTRPRRTPAPRPTTPSPTQPQIPTQPTEPNPPPPPSASPPSSIDERNANYGPSSASAPAPTPTQPDTPSAPRFLSGVPNWLAFWLPIATSLIAIVVAITSFIAATQDPDINMVLPKLVRMVQGEQGAILYVQPRFVSTGRNDRLDVITDISLQIEPIDGGPGANFTWDEQGVWNYDPSARELTYIYIADAGPLMVSPSNPQLPVGLFVGPPNWTFQPGDYRITITANRAVGSTPLQGTMVVSFPESTLNIVNESQGTRFGEFYAKP